MYKYLNLFPYLDLNEDPLTASLQRCKKLEFCDMEMQCKV